MSLKYGPASEPLHMSVNKLAHLSLTRLALGAQVLIGEQSWELAAAVLRNDMNETRKAMLRFAEANPSAVGSSTPFRVGFTGGKAWLCLTRIGLVNFADPN